MLLLGCAGALFVGVPSAAAQEAPAGFDAAVFEVRMEGAPGAQLPALVAADGRVLVPVRAILELTGTPFEVSPDGQRISVARPRGAGRAVLDLAAGAIIGERRTPVESGAAVRWGADLFLATERLADLVEGQVTVEMSSVSVLLARDPPFPAQERLILAQSRRDALRGIGGSGRERASVAFQPRTGGGVLEWGVSSTFPDASLPSAAYARLGVGVWGGMLRMGANLRPSESATELTANYHRVFPEATLVRQVQLGALVTQGLRSRSVQGFAITNAPFLRDPQFGEARFDPQLPTGWEYELYQDGQLLGYSDVAGSPVSVPLRYGSTPVQVRLYGPAGERVTSDVVYLVPTLQLPRGAFQYAASGGVCPREEDCRAFGTIDLRAGATSALTLVGGAEVETDSLASAVRPYAGASFLPAPGWSVEAQAMPGSFYRVNIDDFTARAVSGSAGAGLQYPERRSVVLGADGFSPLPDSTVRWHVDGRLRLRYSGASQVGRAVELGGRVDGSRAAGADRMRLSVSLSLRGVLMEGAYEASPALTDSGTAQRLLVATATAPLGRRAPRWLGAPLATGSVASGNQGLERWEAGISFAPPRGNVQLGARWYRGGGTSLVVGTTLRAGPGRVQGRIGTRAGRTEGGVSVDGGAAFGQGTGVEALPFGGIGMAGIDGRVFHDLDGDGRFSPGDEPVEGAAVGVGSLRARSGADGRFSTWTVLPYEVLRVRLDTATLADPGWIPVRADTLVRPSPHLYTRFDFPLVQTRELFGRVVAGTGVPTPAGVGIDVVNTASGAVEHTVTFSDGEFYIGRVLPGVYDVRVTDSSLRALGARAEPASQRVTVPPGGDQPLVEIPAFQLRRAR